METSKLVNDELKLWHRYLGIVYACWCSFVGVFFSKLLHKLGYTNLHFADIITFIVLPCVIFSIFVPILYKFIKRSEFKSTICLSLIVTILVFLSQFICRFCENKLIYFLGYENLKNLNSEQLMNPSDISPFLKVYSIISILVIGPILEESVYRICLFTTLRSRYSLLSHVITALLFGFQHIAAAVIFLKRYEEFLYIFSYILFSLILTITYEKTKTPIPGIIAHIAINAFFIF